MITSDANKAAISSVPPECITDVDRRRVRLLGSQSASGSSRERPAASISSTNGVGAKKPRPSDALIVQGPGGKARKGAG
jgi:hypothetical protein